ncbi:hypothetical protein [Flavobacterium pallidum]|uniref:Lipocalin-like domain-containing protein n=1 Tax=Flavobacterium pallidum TaxID=2172098 RepID=A0A2S1SI96_9FLAO|nr:hypothetical protein [Flavobacterium pallidum]AWI26134.1 hypothetical protein HYN49_09615 [Flavobacterium pallidum]
MKKILLLPILLIAMCFASCNDDDINTQTLSGEWALTSGNGTISGRTDTFAFGEITWTFHKNHTVDIVNTVTDTDKLSGLPSGKYNYTVQNSNEVEGCPKKITIGTAVFGCASVSPQEIQISDGFADGVGYQLVPMPEVILF